MRKFISMLMMAVFSAGLFAATETTVYYTAPEATIGTQTIKLNVNFKGDGDDWHQFEMTKTDLKHNDDPVYKQTFTDAYDGVGVMQFQLFEGDTWKSQKEAINSWTAASVYNGKMFVHDSGEWVAAPSAGEPGDEPGEEPGDEPGEVKIRTIYLEAGVWNANDAKFFVHVWKTGDADAADYELTLVEGSLFKADIRDDAAKAIFLRRNPAEIEENNVWSGEWNRAETDIPADKDLFSIKGWDVAGEWSVKGAEEPGEEEVKFYVTGDAALVGEDLAWHPDAIAVKADSYTFKDLAAGDYKLKITVDGTWNTAKSYDDLTVQNDAFTTDDDRNIIFSLEKAGDVVVTYTADVFKVEGEFKGGSVDPQPSDVKFYVTGDAALVGEDLAWKPNAIAVKADSYTFKDLAAGDYKLKITVDGTWDTGRGFGSLTVQNDAFTKDDDDNIIFSLEKAGDVVVTYTADVFKVEGEFKGGSVDPQPSDVKFYVTGDAALVGEDLAWKPNAIAVKADSYTFKNLAVGEYKLKITLDGTWDTGRGFGSLTVQNDAFTKDDDDNIIFSLEEAGDVVVTYTSEVFKVEGKFKAAEDPGDEHSYTIYGTFNNWNWEARVAMPNGVVEIPLEANAECLFKVVVDDSGEGQLGFDAVDLECSSKGVELSDEEWRNVKVTMAEAGNLRVEVVEGKLCVTGKFVVPQEEQHSYTIYGTFNEWNWEARVAMPDGVVEIPLEANEECQFKVVVDDQSEGQLAYDDVDLECSSDGVELSDEKWRNVKVVMAEAGNLRVEVVDGKLCVTGKFVAPEKEKFYLVGSITEWAIVKDEQHLFVENPEVAGEYSLHTTLAEGDAIKVVGVLGETQRWFVEDINASYVVDAAHAGGATIYFRPEANPDWSDLEGHIFVAMDQISAIDNTAADLKAVKFIENGQLYIIVNTRVFNAAGQVVR